MSEWVAVDLDGTLAADVRLPDHGIGEPITANVEKLRELRAAGYLIVIHTCRPFARQAKIQGWLHQHEIPFDAVSTDKLPAVRYVDDRAIPADAASWLPHAPQPEPAKCPKCGASGTEPCVSGGYLPVGELSGDVYVDKNKQPAWHKQRRPSSAQPADPPTCEHESHSVRWHGLRTGWTDDPERWVPCPSPAVLPDT